MSTKPFQALLMRSISADPNPEGAGIVEEDASPYFKKSTYPSVHRPFAAGSYGIGQTSVTATPASDVTLSARIYPKLRSAQAQSIVGIGGDDLRIDPDGAISLAIDGRTITLGKALTLRRWYSVPFGCGNTSRDRNRAYDPQGSACPKRHPGIQAVC